MTPEQRLEFIRATARIYRCPNTGKLVETTPGDDKVCCPCGKPNPKNPSREAVNGLVHHHTYLLEAVSPEQYVREKFALKLVK
jgi:hypothetical protein